MLILIGQGGLYCGLSTPTEAGFGASFLFTKRPPRPHRQKEFRQYSRLSAFSRVVDITRCVFLTCNLSFLFVYVVEARTREKTGRAQG